VNALPATIVILAAGDNVGVALIDIAAGSPARTLGGRSLEALDVIPQGHKIALADISAGALIMRYGMAVGLAKAAIGKGRLAHVHNIASRYLNNDEDHYE
jgi:altronate dehydratase small subunit